PASRPSTESSTSVGAIASAMRGASFIFAFELGGELGIAEIGFDHLRIPRHLGRRAFGELLAVIEHDDAIGQAHDRLHQMLDDQNGDAAIANAAYYCNHVLDLGWI